MPAFRSYLLLILFIAGCASNPAHIDTGVDTCCSSAAYKSFDVQVKDVPAFLGPVMVSNFSVAFANKGMQPVQSTGDLHVILSYQQIDIDEPDTANGFNEKIEPGKPVRFIARINIEMHDARTGKIVWAGHIQRLHYAPPGAFMHTGKASMALLDAFTRVLKGYPG